MRTIIQKMLLLVAGVCAGILAVELGMRVATGKPEPLSPDFQFKYAYLDIQERIFVRKGNTYRVRSDINAHNPYPLFKSAEFPVRKGPREKRVFIVGASVGLDYDEDILKNKLQQVLPQFDWNVVNCSFYCFDSHRLRLMVEEMVDYQPDLMVLVPGHNDGVFNPVMVSALPYRHAALAGFHVFRLLAGVIDPPLFANTEEEVQANFENNIVRMLGMLEQRGIPAVVCTLPMNHRIPETLVSADGFDFAVREWFPDLHLLKKDHRRLLKKPFIAHPYRHWIYGRAYEREGMKEKAIEHYGKNENAQRVWHNQLLKKAVAESRSSMLADFDRRLRDISSGAPGFEYFRDRAHFWMPVYELLSDDIIEVLRGNPSKAGLPDRSEWNTRYARTPMPSVLEQNRKHCIRIIENASPDGSNGFVYLRAVSDEARFEGVKELLKWCLDFHPVFLKELEKKIRSPEAAASPFAMNGHDAALLLGELQSERGNYRAALSYFDTAVELDPEDYCGYFLRGLCHFDKGDIRQSGRDFAHLHRLRPDCSWLTTELLAALQVDRRPGSNIE